jgi:phosphate transport system protein
VATRIKFQQNLDDLKERLLIMAGMAEQAIQRSIEAYRARDLSICELVFQSEPVINRLEREIDQMALDLLAMEQPMAIDLRFILSVIRINADLERVGDQAVNIAVDGCVRKHRSAGRYSQASVTFLGHGAQGAAGVY